MFKFLKDKLKKAISAFSKKAEEEAEEEVIEVEVKKPKKVEKPKPKVEKPKEVPKKKEIKVEEPIKEIPEEVKVEEVEEKPTVEEEIKERQDELREGQYSQLSAMSTMLKTNDPYTVGHQRYVAHFAQAIARGMGVPEEVDEGIWAAGIVHDIGKIQVYPQILSKSGELTAAEREMVRTHTTEGHKILRPIKTTWPLAKVALQHHERIDGSGYPNQAEGDSIILEARIMAVADTVDAMGTRRPYRARKPFKEIIEVLLEGKDRTLQAEAVDAALDLLEKKGNEFNIRYRDPPTPIPEKPSPPPQ